MKRLLFYACLFGFQLLILSTIAECRGTASTKRPDKYQRVKGVTVSKTIRNHFPAYVKWQSVISGLYLTSLSWRKTFGWNWTFGQEPDFIVCFNAYDPVPQHLNSSVITPWYYGNKTVMGVFICPLDSNEPHKVYCCSPEDRETCCGFWDELGRLIGVICGIVGGIALIIGLCWWLYMEIKNHKHKPHANQNPMQMQQQQMMQPQQPGMPPPPSYNVVAGAGYNYGQQQYSNTMYWQKPDGEVNQGYSAGGAE